MKDIAIFLYEMGQLKRVRRSGWWIAGIDHPESVAEHEFRVAIIGYVLAYLEGANPMKTVMMCLFHDTHEARLNDPHRVARNYLSGTEAERRALREQISRLPQEISDELLPLISEFEERKSVEARLARDADLLECLIQAREYQAQGYEDTLEWIESCRVALATDSAKAIAEECLRVKPSEWWQGLKSAKPRNSA